MYSGYFKVYKIWIQIVYEYFLHWCLADNKIGNEGIHHLLEKVTEAEWVHTLDLSRNNIDYEKENVIIGQIEDIPEDKIPEIL